MAPDPELVSQAEHELEAVRDEWLARQGVVSVEVARRWTQGPSPQPTDEVCIRVTVEEILPLEDVPEGELFPGRLGGVPVQLREGSAPAPEPA